MIQLHVTYTMKTGIHPKAFFDALNAANIPSLCRHEKGNIRYSYYLPADNDNQLFLLEIWKNNRCTYRSSADIPLPADSVHQRKICCTH